MQGVAYYRSGVSALTEDKNVTKIKSICYMCQTNDSGIVAHVKDGVIVKIEGDVDCPPNHGRLCVKGLAAPFMPNNPSRVLKPLKRTNPEKGLGVDPKWKEISWEEAYEIIVPKLKKIREENPLKLVLSMFDYPPYYLAIPWCAAFGAQFYVGAATWCGWYHNACYQYYLSFFREADYEHTNYLLLWGTQSGHIIDALPVSSAKKLADARVRGAKVVVIDPVATPAASLADEWVPIRPGTDGALALCFANLLLNEYGLYDREFIKARTNGPYLVGPDELYLRDRATNKPLVWDENKKEARPFNEVKAGHMALEGEYEVYGTYCRPAFQILKTHLEKFTPASTSKVTTIPEEDIRRIAKEFGEAAQVGSTIEMDGVSLPYRPSVVLTGRGASAHRHAMHTVFAMEMLNVLVGNVNVPGGVLGIATGYTRRWETGEDEDGIALSPNSTYWHFYGALDTYPARPVVKPRTYTLLDLCPVATYTDGLFPLALGDGKRFGLDYDIEFMIIAHVNPVATYVNPGEMVERLKKINFILGFATEWNEAMEMCDVVLPNAHWTERYDPIANPPFKFEGVGRHDWYWFFRRPVINPPSPEIKHWIEILLDITEQAGFIKDFYQAYNVINCLREPYQLDPEKKHSYLEVCDAVMQDRYGVSVEWYEKNKTNVCVQKKSVEEAFPGPFVPGRYNIYMEYWKRAGEEVKKVVTEMGIEQIWETDDYRPLLEWWPCPSFEKKDGYDLFAVNFKVACHTFSHTTHNPLLLELGHTYPWIYGAQINSETAKAKGIRDGDEIRIESEFGYQVQGKAVVTEGIHPECVGLSGVFGRLAFGEKVGRKVGPHWNTLVGQNLERVDKMSTSLDGCIRVKVTKV